MGKSELPIEEIHADAVSFLKGVMAAQPAERWSAESALHSTWLEDVVNEEKKPATLARTLTLKIMQESQRVNSEPSQDSVDYHSVQFEKDLPDVPVHYRDKIKNDDQA